MTEPWNPREECDLVMKGGITSGVVYPQAILELRKRYRFRSIGGGSVGGITAALAAAAELGRENQGFEKLDEEREKLKQPEFLLKVFRASSNTKPLMDVALESKRLFDEYKKDQRKGPLRLALNLNTTLKRYSSKAYREGRLKWAAWAALVGAGLGLILYLLLLAIAELVVGSLSGWPIILLVLVLAPALGLGLIGFLLGGPASSAYALYRILTKEMPEKNFFGMCLGHEDDTAPDQEPLLTDWLCGLVNQLAGKDKDGPPLTFCELKKEGKPAIDLKVLAANLNQQEPYIFPRNLNTFVFNSEEMRRFFPEPVVKHMEDNAALKDVRLPDGFHFLPEGDELPIIVPVRMGISFPILLSTVPLYTIKSSAWKKHQEDPSYALKEDDLLQNLFSDGGICSNFPIHFFDAWLPTRPTFGINLTSLPGDKETFEISPKNVIKRVDDANADRTAGLVADPSAPWLPRPDEPENLEWSGFKTLTEFGMAIFHSAQNYRDNMQSRLPSYKERIVQVRLGKDEGGLNLSMDTDLIEDMERKGERAGTLLCEGFTPEKLDHHRWVRLRVLMDLLETNLKELREGPRLATICEIVDRQRQEDFPFSTELTKSQSWCEGTKWRIGLLTKLAEDWQGQQEFFEPVSEDEIQPELRVTPDV